MPLVHVARFSDGGVEMGEIREAVVAEPERAWSGVWGLMGEGGAYISDS